MGVLSPVACKQSSKLVLNQENFCQIKECLCLDNENIRQLYQSFTEIVQYNRSYFDLDDFVAYFRRDIDNFVELPYAQRLFECMAKQKQNKIFFQQFAKGITAFCLLNKEGLLHFIFDLIDVDGDDKISKKDIQKLIEFKDPLTGDYTFFINFKPDLDRFPMKQNQTKIDFDYFRMNYEKLTFMIWPAFSLQEYLRQCNMGIEFWYDLYGKVEKKQNEIKNNEKKQLRIKEKLQVLKNMKNRVKKTNFIKQKLNIREMGQNADDSKVLKRKQGERRKSVAYIKPQLCFSQLQREEQVENEKVMQTNENGVSIKT